MLFQPPPRQRDFSLFTLHFSLFTKETATVSAALPADIKKSTNMKIQINNTPKETQATTLSALISEAGLPEKGIAAAIDNKMIPKAEWESTPLHEGANIVIIKAACGG